MKKTLLIFIALTARICSAQVTMAGMSSQGGYNNHGTIFTIDTDGTFAVQYNFNEGLDGYAPFGNMVQDADGNLYGLASKGGSNNMGTLFMYHPDFHSITNIGSFSGKTGAGPRGSLIIGSNGNLIGMANTGGKDGVGTIFECTTKGDLTIMASFDKTNGAYPVGSLVEDKDHNFYGMTRMGGEYNNGVIFKCTSEGAITILHSFSGTDGSQPSGNLIILDNQKLYGVTRSGGSSNVGVIFCCDFAGNYKLLNSFDNTTGNFPCGSLLDAGNGYLYGTTYLGGKYSCGTLFRCDAWGKIIVLAQFNDSIGAHPMGSLTMAGNGCLYGVTCSGGSTTHADAGVIFKYNILQSKLSCVYEFSTAGPCNAQGNLVMIDKSMVAGSTASKQKLYASHKVSHPAKPLTGGL